MSNFKISDIPYVPTSMFIVTLTEDERTYLLLCLGIGLEEHSLKPGKGLTAEGVIRLREKLTSGV